VIPIPQRLLIADAIDLLLLVREAAETGDLQNRIFRPANRDRVGPLSSNSTPKPKLELNSVTETKSIMLFIEF
jgi:hypothetical protein